MSFLAGFLLGVLITLLFSCYELEKIFYERVKNAESLEELKKIYK